MFISKNKIIVSGALLLFMFFLLGGLATYEQMRRLPDNLYIGELSLSGQNRDEALVSSAKLIEKLETMKYEIVIDNSLKKSFSSRELGIYYNAQKTIQNIFSETSWMANVFSNKSYAQEENVSSFEPILEVDHEQLKASLEEYLLAQERDFVNAQIIWRNKNWQIELARPGLILLEGDLEKIAGEIIASAFPYRETVGFNASYEQVEAGVFREDLESLLNEIKLVSTDPVTLFFDDEETVLNLTDSQEWFHVDQLEQIITFNEDYARDWIMEYARINDSEAEELIISEIKEIISEYDGLPFKKAIFSGGFGKGRKIKQAKILSELKEMLLDTESERKIIVDWDSIQPKISSRVEGYNFPQIISTGVSSFRYGSYYARVKNIKLSLDSLNAVVVDPGEEFSFNRATGWITQRKGYMETEVIIEGRVEKDIGGGVCQTSTTMYRAILNAGFPTTQRRNHTLDVIYYHKYGYGLDATVFAESRADLRFINDLPGPIIINTYTIDKDLDAFVEFYGITDGRRVELTNIPTGKWLYKLWDWKIIWPDREELRTIKSIYQLPREDEEEE